MTSQKALVMMDMFGWGLGFLGGAGLLEETLPGLPRREKHELLELSELAPHLSILPLRVLRAFLSKHAPKAEIGHLSHSSL